ncbi:hypothetical protein Tco_0196105 [Tanacetum coccineum]
MRELRDAFSGNKNDDAHEHVEQVLDIVSLFNIPGVTHDAVMLRVFPITLTGAAKRYCPPSKTAKQLEDIRNFKQEGDETLYQAWERNIDSNSSSEGIPAIVSKLDSLGLDMKKLKENVHDIQVRCQTWGGTHLDKECPLNEEVKSLEEVKYGEPFLNYNQNDERFNRRVAGYGSHVHPSLREKKPSLTEIINKHMEEAAKRHAEQEKWLRKFYQNIETNRENHDKIIQGLETKVKNLTNELEGRTNGECKAIFTKDRSPLYTPFYYSS